MSIDLQRLVMIQPKTGSKIADVKGPRDFVFEIRPLLTACKAWKVLLVVRKLEGPLESCEPATRRRRAGPPVGVPDTT